MSLYIDFIKDFGSRHKRLLEKVECIAHLNDLDVTLMLSIATSGIIIPYERLNERSVADKWTDEYKEAIQPLKDLKNSSINESPLWAGNAFNEWKYAFMKSEHKEHLEDFFDALNGHNLNSMQKAEGCPINTDSALSIIRNSLAHGNIQTLGRKDEIETIWFVSEYFSKDKRPARDRLMQHLLYEKVTR